MSNAPTLNFVKYPHVSSFLFNKINSYIPRFSSIRDFVHCGSKHTDRGHTIEDTNPSRRYYAHLGLTQYYSTPVYHVIVHLFINLAWNPGSQGPLVKRGSLRNRECLPILRMAQCCVTC